jgi:hypothetical protein
MARNAACTLLKAPFAVTKPFQWEIWSVRVRSKGFCDTPARVSAFAALRGSRANARETPAATV